MTDTTSRERTGARSASKTARKTSVSGANRQAEILDAAAELFAEKGYNATSIRDIGSRVGLLGGSLYHYIKSKNALFVAVHDAALDQAQDQILSAIAAESDPWKRLHIAVETLFKLQLDPSSITMPIMNDFRSVPDDVRANLVARRDKFEQVFADLVAELPMAAGIDRSIFRLSLLTLANSSDAWYRKGRLTPSDIADQIMRIFRHEPNAT